MSTASNTHHESATIHASAWVDPQARLDEGVVVGPRCHVGAQVHLMAGVQLMAGVHVEGPTVIGAGTTVYPYAVIGMPGQDFKFKPGDPTPGVAIGPGCVIREHVTIHAATRPEHPTTIGRGCYLMVASHVGHDCVVGDHVVMVNSALLAGHVTVGDRAILSGNTAVHQFCRVGRLAMISGGVATSMDVPPFCLCDQINTTNALNLVGLRRAGVPRESIDRLRLAFRTVFGKNLLRGEMLERLAEVGQGDAYVAELAEFIATSSRGVGRSPQRRGRRS
ncbi:MAG: acyl-[acyl-carrier-protein]--UDP-N-acetylglucosamine O-acyltransferase [Phycisphaerales bacterium]|nr:MAG: acyl-[acyl-carrier-protein]--UDP-N-acetylglucosamine O-acyltransferase [Phycisphaerales bacterium]